MLLSTAIFYITENGLNLAKRLQKLYPEGRIEKFNSKEVRDIWHKHKNLIFIMAAGIVVRTIASLIKDKKTDPAVVVLDEKGKYAISLLSGHIGGANQLANDIANFLGGHSVITSAQLYLRPKNLIIGIGCNKGTSANEIENSIKTVLYDNNMSFLSIHSIATIDIKGNEKGLKEFAEKYDFKINTYTSDELNAVVSLQPSALSLSDTVFKATGAKGVAEPSALLSSGNDKLLVAKQKIGNVTIAVAKQKSEVRSLPLQALSGGQKSEQKGKIFIVGTGPGGIEHITPYAQKAIKKSDVIVGYGTYLDLIQELIKDKEVISTGMTQEIDRCKKAVEIALSGKTVSVISGGDPGIYAMAGLVFDIYRGMASHAPVNIEVIPGISALNACAARLGAPLMHDFAVISLSDRLTSWELIEKRLAAAAISDFVTVLYNPKSMGRPEHINKARAIFLRHRSTETPVGIVKGAMRENERIIITNLRDMLNYDIDMQTTVIIGNSQTFVWNNYMITPRGYKNKFHL